jgi:MinD superfamily P-loop ATPase
VIVTVARADEIASFCAERGVMVVGRVPYDTAVTRAMVHGQPVTACVNEPVAEALERVWRRVRDGISRR